MLHRLKEKEWFEFFVLGEGIWIYTSSGWVVGIILIIFDDATLVTLPILCLLWVLPCHRQWQWIRWHHYSWNITTASINWLPWSFDISSLWTKEEKKQQRIQRTRCRGIMVHINNILNPRPFYVGTVKIF